MTPTSSPRLSRPPRRVPAPRAAPLVAALVAALMTLGCGGGGEMPGADHEPGADHGSVVAYTGTTLWDGTGAPALEGATLLVRDGRIESVSQAAPPPEAEVVDLSGTFITPGFIDTHAHVTGRWAPESIQDPAARVAADLALFARYGVTTVNSLGGEPEEALAVRGEQNSADLTRARVQVAGPVVVERTAAEARARSEANVAMGVDWLKLRIDDNLGTAPKLPWEAVEAVMAVGSESDVPVATHIFYEADAARALEMGSGLIAHSVRDQPVSPGFVTAMRESGVCYVPTLTREVSTFVYAERPDFFDDPFFQAGADPAEVARVSEPEFMTAMRDSDAAAAYRRALVQAQENLATLAEAGVPVAFGTDAGPAARFPGYFEHLEMDLMAEAGMEPEAILVSATSGAAACLGLDEVGTLEPGRWADFLVFSTDPLADVAATRTLDRVYIAGNEIPR